MTFRIFCFFTALFILFSTVFADCPKLFDHFGCFHVDYKTGTLYLLATNDPTDIRWEYIRISVIKGENYNKPSIPRSLLFYVTGLGFPNAAKLAEFDAQKQESSYLSYDQYHELIKSCNSRNIVFCLWKLPLMQNDQIFQLEIAFCISENDEKIISSRIFTIVYHNSKKWRYTRVFETDSAQNIGGAGKIKEGLEFKWFNSLDEMRLQILTQNHQQKSANCNVAENGSEDPDYAEQLESDDNAD